MERFILNYGAKEIHDRENLTETCNTDQIENRGEASPEAALHLIVDQGWDTCGWCIARPDETFQREESR